MKLYSSAPQSSTSMVDDPELRATLSRAINEYNPRVAIETGTYLGAGSTRLIAETLASTGNPITFVTMEVRFKHWKIAKNNLRRFPFVDSRWGCSVDIDEAIHFIENDEAIKNRDAYPDIFIDDVSDPVGFYTGELHGLLHEAPEPRSAAIRSALRILLTGKPPENTSPIADLSSGNGLLKSLLVLHKDNAPLIALDSAGGCGLLEFQTTMKEMADRPFLLLLDDTHHLKHFRSLKEVKSSPRFKIIGESELNGWVLARHH